MANINRDYLIINDVKKSNVSLDNGSITFYITDKNTQNIFVNLVINISDNNLIQKYANIENAEDYTLTMHIVKPDNTYEIIQGKLHDKANAIFEFDLPDYCCDKVGSYRCELLTKCYINNREEITTSNKITYKVKSSVLNDLDEITEAPEYPLVIQLFDKLSNIEQYEEDRRANELARQLAEEQRQTRFNALDADMTDSIQVMDNKVADVENRIAAKEDAVDKLIVDTKADIDNYKVAKDQEIDEYKATKDTEINNAITAQNNKIDEAISKQNDRITVVENNVVAQNNRLDIVENKNQQQDNRLNDIEAKNVEQDNRLNEIEAIDVAQNTRLDAIEAKNQQQDDRLLDIEKVNKRQDMNLKCLFAESKNNMIDVTEEGNSIYLQNSTTGYTLIDEIKGNTLVNCNKEPHKELILNGNINTSGDNTVTITEGVDSGLVDVTLEGNTLVNVSKTKDSTAITKAYTVENSGNHIALQGDVDGSCRPVVTGNTLVNLWTDTNFPYTLNPGTEVKIKTNMIKSSTTYTVIIYIGTNTVISTQGTKEVAQINPRNASSALTCDNNSIKEGEIGLLKLKFTTYANTETTEFVVRRYSSSTEGELVINSIVILEGDYTDKPIPDYFTGLQSSFEDNLVTQEMVDSAEEAVDNLGKYKVEYKSTREDGTVGSTKTLYLNSPLLEGDTIEEKDGGIYHVHRSDEVVFDGSNDEDWSIALMNNVPFFFKTNTIIRAKSPHNAIKCDKVKTVTYNVLDNGSDYGINLTYYLRINFPNCDARNGATVNDLRSYLQQNPITVLYQLASPTYELIEQSNLAIDSYSNGHLDFNTAIPVKKVEFLPFSEELTYLYANTQYTVQFISTKAITADITLGGTKLLAQSIVKGLNRISITTPATLTDNKLIISGVGANIMEVIVTNIDRELIYFEGMKSVGEGGNLVITSSNSDNSLSNAQQLTHEPLRAVGDVKDRYVLIDGKWYIERNCKELVLDSPNERMRRMVTNNADKYRFRLISLLGDIKEGNAILSNKYPKSINTYNCDTGVSCGTEDDGRITFYSEQTSSMSIEQFKSWIVDNPITVVYALATPIYEPIDYNPLEVYSNTTHITTNSTIPTNITVKNHGFNCLLKPSTTYTISSNLGLNTVTTPSVLTEDCLRFMDTDTSDVTTMRDVLVLEGDWTTKADLIPTKFSGMESAFEQEYDAGKGKYKVNVKVANEDKSKENNITFYINEPLRGVGDVKDRIYVKDDKVVVQRNCGIRPYEDGDFVTYLTDKIDTVYPLAAPTYEEVEYNDTKLFIESFKNSTLSYNSNVPVTSTVHYSYSVPIVDTVAQTANVTDQQDSMIIDLATSVAVMEMMLM